MSSYASYKHYLKEKYRKCVLWGHEMLRASKNSFIENNDAQQTCDHMIIFFQTVEWNQWSVKQTKKFPSQRMSEMDNTNTWQLRETSIMKLILQYVINFNFILFKEIMLVTALTV